MSLAHIMDYSTKHQYIDRNIQPNVTDGICNYNVNNWFKIVLCMHIVTQLSKLSGVCELARVKLSVLYCTCRERFPVVTRVVELGVLVGAPGDAGLQQLHFLTLTWPGRPVEQPERICGKIKTHRICSSTLSQDGYYWCLWKAYFFIFLLDYITRRTFDFGYSKNKKNSSGSQTLHYIIPNIVYI